MLCTTDRKMITGLDGVPLRMGPSFFIAEQSKANNLDDNGLILI